MAMKPIAVFFMLALIPAAVMTAHARTMTSSQGNADQKSVAGVAGPATAAQNSNRDASKEAPADRASVAHPSRKSLKKVRVTPPPPMHDPN
jgi:hypothetical protein